jgi:hypothetical protein
MRLRASWIVPLAPVALVVACNTVSPEDCWLNTSGGLGGGGPIPIGAGVGATSSGDFSSPPEGPLDVGGLPNPCIEPGSPCEEKCLTQYESRAAGCAGIADAAPRKACQDDAYLQYKNCRATCDKSAGSTCQEKYEDCIDNAPASCLKESGGTSQCKRCQQRCEAGDSPTPTCRKCRF